MEYTIKDYTPEYYKDFEQMTEDIQVFIQSLDEWDMMTLSDQYGGIVAEQYLDEVAANNGVIKLVFSDCEVIGTGMAVAYPPEKLVMNKYAKQYHKTGFIRNVYIKHSYRKQGIGEKLINELEQFLQVQKCTSIRLNVFEPNIGAHALYRRLGYRDHNTEMLKKLK